MGRFTVRLPDTLHAQLTSLAESEGVSLIQYIVYALTRQVTLAYTVQAVPEHEIAQQRASYAAVLESLGHATYKEIEAILAEREPVEPEPGLDRARLARLQERLAEYRVSSQKEDQDG